MSDSYVHPDGLNRAVLPYLETIPETYRQRVLDLFYDAACVRVPPRIEARENLLFLVRWFKQSAILNRLTAEQEGNNEAASAYSTMEMFAGAYKEAGMTIALWASRKFEQERRARH